jgi:hypothetical protein
LRTWRSGEQLVAMVKGPARQRLRESAFWRAYGRHRYGILFYTLLAMLVAMPVASAFGQLEIVVRLLLAGCLLAAVMPNATKQSRYLILTSLIAVILAGFVAERGDVPVRLGIVAAVTGFIGLLAAAAALRFAIDSNRVDHEVVYAALSSYVLAGLFLGQLYFSIENFWPGSITGPDALSQTNAVYFSFVTIASLGYGDFLPRSGIARGLATLEVIGGQLYLAALVARLIGLFHATKGPR